MRQRGVNAAFQVVWPGDFQVLQAKALRQRGMIGSGLGRPRSGPGLVVNGA